MQAIGFALALGLSFIHAFLSRVQWLYSMPKRPWISLSAGISVAYIFLHVFPELSHAQMELDHSELAWAAYLENHVYLLALVGLAIFYGLESLALRARRHRSKTIGMDSTDSFSYWIHIGSFALYNGILGYLFRESADHGLAQCFLLFVTLGLHFLVSDVSLREHHKQSYDTLGRWILAMAIMLGWAIGLMLHLDAAGVAIVWSVVAGGVILNALKEELPENSSGDFRFFSLGAIVYTALLLL
ncbi:MAG: hypothetical protein AAF974_03385 [Cyanobacteria bacterium P01_E01_bin.34]